MENEMLLLIIGAAGLFLYLARVMHVSKKYMKKAEETVIDRIRANKNFGLALKEIDELEKLEWPQYREEKQERSLSINQKITSLEDSFKSLKKRVQLGFRDQLFYYLFCPENKLQDHCFNLKLKDIYLKKVEETKNKIPTDGIGIQKKHEYYRNNPKIKRIKNVLSKIEDVLAKYNRVVREINEAQSAISEAETMETLDMVSSNKGLSVLSSLSTSEANSEIQDIKPVLEDFKQSLKKLESKELEQDLPEVDDSFDLVFDFVFDGGFDFFSMLNLFSLGEADSDLEELKDKISPVGSNLRKSESRAKELIEKELEKLP